MCCVLCRDKARFPVGKGIAGYVADTAETLNVANVYEVELQTKVHGDSVLHLKTLVGTFSVIVKSLRTFV